MNRNLEVMEERKDGLILISKTVSPAGIRKLPDP